MKTSEWEKKDTLAVITMCNGANKQNPVFVEDMNHCLDHVQADKEISSVVLTSSDEKNFSQGIDVDWLGRKMAEQDFDSIKSFLHGINGVFKRLLLFDLPVVAAINGHAFGNGAMLACACDFRFMKKDKGFFCFPEVDIGIPFWPGMYEFVGKAVPAWKLNELLLTGKRAGAEELEHSHVIEKACENQTDLMKAAVAFAAGLQKKRGIFGELKKRKHRRAIEIMETQDAELINTLNLFVAE